MKKKSSFSSSTRLSFPPEDQHFEWFSNKHFSTDSAAHLKHTVLSGLQSEERHRRRMLLLSSSRFLLPFTPSAPYKHSLSPSLPPSLSPRAQCVPYRANEGCMLWWLVASTQIEVPSAVTNLFGFCPPHSN